MMQRNLQYTMVYDYPPEKVWHVLTDRTQISYWLMNNDFKPKVGYRATFTGSSDTEWGNVVYSEVKEVEDNRRLAYTWELNVGKDATMLIWNLEPYNDGSKITLEHTGFKGLSGLISSYAFNRVWKNVVQKKLPAVLDLLEEEEQGIV